MEFSLALREPSQRYIPPEIKIPPPLNGTLKFRGTYPSIEFIESLVNVQGGIHFRSLEMGDARKAPLQMLIDACPDTIESITFWTGYREYLRFHSPSHIRAYTPHKRKLYRTSGNVLPSKGSGSHWRVESKRTTASKLTCPEFFRASYPHPSPSSS